MEIKCPLHPRAPVDAWKQFFFSRCLVSKPDGGKAETWKINQRGAEVGEEAQTLPHDCALFQTCYLQSAEVVQEEQSDRLSLEPEV